MQETGPTPRVPTKTTLPVAAGVATILLVIASDLLLFDAEPGINLFVMTLSIALATALFAARRRRSNNGMLGLATIALVQSNNGASFRIEARSDTVLS